MRSFLLNAHLAMAAVMVGGPLADNADLDRDATEIEARAPAQDEARQDLDEPRSLVAGIWTGLKTGWI